jgi:hypothetical protein
MKALTMTNQTKSSKWIFAAKSAVAFAGFPLGGLAGMAVVGAVDNGLEGLIGGAFTGAVLGTAQWLALRDTKLVNAWWIAATTVGLGVGVGLATAIVGAGTSFQEIISRAPITGLALGLAQWFALRKEVKNAAWWIPTITAAYTIGWAITLVLSVKNFVNFIAGINLRVNLAK